jgi:orotidine-5'-phosphate decarboxylase
MTDRKLAERIYCALDTADLAQAMALSRTLGDAVGGFKLGLEFFGANGPAGVRALVSSGRAIFLDLKLHDIPNTVAGAAREAAKLGVSILNVHAAGGPEMLRAAREAAIAGARTAGVRAPKLIAVTVLTSLGPDDLDAVGQDRMLERQVLRLAALADAAGLDGVVCSPLEIAALRRERGPDFLLIVPGIRPGGPADDDQKRVATPAAAVRAGADYLVIGRPITAASDPREAALSIAASLG